MSKITDKLIFELIKQHYRPTAQAWELGMEAAMRSPRLGTASRRR